MKIFKNITLEKKYQAAVVSILIGITVFFSACKKDTAGTGNSSDTDPRDGSTWILNEVVYYYEANNLVPGNNDPDSPLYGFPHLGNFQDTAGVFKLVAKDTVLDGKKWLAIYSSGLVAYPDIYGPPGLFIYLQKRSDGWWLKKADTPNQGVEALWLPIDDFPGFHNDCVNLFQSGTFDPARHTTVNLQHATYVPASSGAMDPHRYLISYDDPDENDGVTILSRKHITNYSNTGQVFKIYMNQETEAEVSDPLHRYVTSTLITVSSFTR